MKALAVAILAVAIAFGAWSIGNSAKESVKASTAAVHARNSA